MKYLKPYNESKVEIHQWMYEFSILDYTINKDGSVDIENTLGLHDIWVDEIPFKINYAPSVIATNCHLTSLKNFPTKVYEEYSGALGTSAGDNRGYYWVGDNQLTSLEGCPKKVKRFIASDNQLTSLKGAPEYVYDACYLNGNQLESMEGCPKYIGLKLDIYDNPLKSLIGIPPDMMIFQEDKSVLNYKEKNGVYTFRANPEMLDAYWDDVLQNEPEYFKYLKKVENFMVDGCQIVSFMITKKLWDKYKHLDRSNKLWDFKS